jgi:peptidoglycan-associated lipoprotein
MAMIPVQRGRGGWVISGSTIARAVVVVSLGAMLVMGCSSKKKPNGINDANGANGIGTNGVGGSNTPGFDTGSLGKNEHGPLNDIHFAYNEYTIEAQDGSVLRSNASWLQTNAQTRVQVEGHCDERGSEEYNIALGAKRAQAAKDYLVTLGIPGSRISTISYGKELPTCQDHDESCWSQNRRDHFAVAQ